MAKVSQGLHMKAAKTGRIRTRVYMQIAAIKSPPSERGHCMRGVCMGIALAKELNALTSSRDAGYFHRGIVPEENFRKLSRKLCSTRKKSAPFVFEFEETALIVQVFA